MIIDCHSHHISKPYNTRYIQWLEKTKCQDYGPAYLWNNPVFEDISERLRIMDENCIDYSVITYSANIVQIIDSLTDSDCEHSKIVTDLNQKTWNIVQENRERICSTALIDLRLGASAIEEMERTSDWAIGFSILTAYRIGGKIRFLDDEIFRDFWAKAAELRKPIFIHFSSLYPVRNPENPLPGYMNDSMLNAGFGQLMENSLCLTRLVMSGLFERFPNIKIVMGQLGGMYPFMLERFEMLYCMHLKGAMKKGIDVKNPSDAEHFMRNYRNYTDNIYVDTHSMDVHSIACAVETLGEDKILFGSDLPITPSEWGITRGIQQLQLSGFPEKTINKILYENAEKLLKFS